MAEQAPPYIHERLIAHGWVTVPSAAGALVSAQKVFETAVGNKVASVHFYESKTEPLYCTWGEYQSERRNVLASIFPSSVSRDATPSQLRDFMAAFLIAVEKEIDASYARSLFLQHGVGKAS